MLSAEVPPQASFDCQRVLRVAPHQYRFRYHKADSRSFQAASASASPILQMGIRLLACEETIRFCAFSRLGCKCLNQRSYSIFTPESQLALGRCRKCCVISRVFQLEVYLDCRPSFRPPKPQGIRTARKTELTSNSCGTHRCATAIGH